VPENNILSFVDSISDGFYRSDSFLVEDLAENAFERVTVNKPPIQHLPVDFIVYVLFDQLFDFIGRILSERFLLWHLPPP
jgi:hypothetical protein